MVKKTIHKLQIPRRMRRCFSCEEPFNPDDAYRSVLRIDAEEQFKREDYCAGCWSGNDTEAILSGAKSHWLARVPTKSVEEEPSEPLDRMLELFTDASQGETQKDKAVAFLLGLLLLRKKRIYLRQEVEIDGTRTSLYEIPETEEMIAVPAQTITMEQVDSLQTTLNEALYAKNDNEEVQLSGMPPGG